MPGTNDFLPFATAAGANVVSQATYAGLSAIATGYQAGVAQSAQLNKTWRQSSIMAAVVAQFIVDTTGANAVDDGTIATLEANFIAALRLAGVFIGTDTGAANACVVNLTPPVTALTDNMVLWFKAKAANTGATTLNVNGLGAQPLVGAANVALQGGEIVANGKCLVVWDATISKWVLIECTGAALQVAPASASGHALQQGQKGYASFTSSGSLVVPAGVTKMRVSATAAGGGAGGGGGGGGGTGTAVGGGGGAGGVGQNIVRQEFTVVPGQTITVTIGTKGNGGSASGAVGNNGSAGGNTTITNLSGGTVSLIGGGAGAGGANATGTTSGGAPGNPGYPIGQYGQDATNGTSSASGGMGGSSPFGGGGGGGRGAAIPGANSPGNNATGYGAGGGGGGGVYGGSGGFTNGLAGGNGGDGFAFFEW